jgi:hypothetical protein
VVIDRRNIGQFTGSAPRPPFSAYEPSAWPPGSHDLPGPSTCSICTSVSRRPALLQEKTLLERQIEATDRQIDALVDELYGLTEDEIKIVEEKLLILNR